MTASPREKARVGRLRHRPGQVDPTDAGEAPDDLSRAGRGERVLVVDARVRHAYHHLALVEVFEGELLEARNGFFLDLADAVGLEISP